MWYLVSRSNYFLSVLGQVEMRTAINRDWPRFDFTLALTCLFLQHNSQLFPKIILHLSKVFPEVQCIHLKNVNRE